MSDQVVVGFGWRAAIDKEILRMQMMRLADGERPMVRELRAFVVSVTDRNEAEFMSRFRQFGNIDDPDFPVYVFHGNRASWKRLGVVCLRQLLLLPLRLLGFHLPLKVRHRYTSQCMLSTTDPRNADLMQIDNGLVGFVSLCRRKNDFDKAGVEMR